MTALDWIRVAIFVGITVGTPCYIAYGLIGMWHDWVHGPPGGEGWHRSASGRPLFRVEHSDDEDPCDRIVRQLGEVYRPKGVEIWLRAPNPSLDGKRPIALMLDGDFEPVVEAVERLESGAM